jgi:hypothetical protein
MNDTRPPPLQHKHIARLRKGRVAKLLASSHLSLKAWQMDMDCPPEPRAVVREQLTRLLLEQTGKTLAPDYLHIHFSTDTHPAVSVDGQEIYGLRLSLTEIAMATFDGATFYALVQSAEPERTMDDVSLSTRQVLQLIDNTDWSSEYEALLRAFWSRYQSTYCTLAKLSFLDTLGRQRKRQIISQDGYQLGLEALGLTRFPASVEELESAGVGSRTEASVLAFNGQIVPCLFQLTSNNTHHSFIHVLGHKPAVTEYIGDNPQLTRQKMLDAINNSAALAAYLHGAADDRDDPHRLEVITVDGDIFSALTAAHLERSLDRLTLDGLFLLVERGLSLISTLDYWPLRTEILERIPHPAKATNRLMRAYLKQRHELDLDPDHVFLRYVPGKTRTPLGSPQAPVTYVHSPASKPISLSDALLTHYRVDRPVGYLDEDGRTEVYTDPSGKGTWAEEARLNIAPEAIEQYIKAFGFLQWMSKRLEQFWQQHGAAIEQLFKTTFIAQAMIGLKQRQLSRPAFDLLVQMLDETSANAITPAMRCTALGFDLQLSVVDGAQCQPCAGLLTFSHRDRPLTVLYQPGQPMAFVEFHNDSDLNRYLQHAAKDESWRNALLTYLPTRVHQKFSYILEVWAGKRTPGSPASVLRPWTNVIYANDLRKAQARIFCEQPVVSSPFAFVRQTLQRNFQADADDQIVTSKEVSLRYWTAQLNHLQLLLAPLSLFITPAILASLAAHAGSIYLNIETARLPGNRADEKTQALLNGLSFALFHLPPATPRLLGSFSKFATTGKTVNAAATANRSFSLWLGRSTHPRKTRLQPFFQNNSLLKSWDILGHQSFGTLPVKAWKLGRKFLLWTSDKGQARTLVVSTHGYHLPWTKTTAIPNGTELRTYAPHGYELVDPRLHRVVSQRVSPFSLLTNVDNTAAHALPPYLATDKLLAGTSLTGRIKNYSLSKFQSTTGETYQDISNVVRNSNLPPWHGQLPKVPMDVLSVRNRFGMTPPTLEDLFKTLARQGIHYDKILLVHCRCSALKSLLGLAPDYTAPSVSVLAPPIP